MRSFFKWFWRVIKKGVWLAGGIPYLLDFIAAYIPADLVPTPLANYAELGITLQGSLVLLSAGIFVSVYLVHRETEIQFAESKLAWEAERQLLQGHISELLATEANISLSVIEQGFHPSFSGTKPTFPNAPKIGPYGFTENGLPGWASLWANVEVKNTGWEAGELEWELDETTTKIPPIFIIGDVDEYGKFSYLGNIKRRDKFTTSLYLYVKIAPAYQEPQAFAKALGSLDEYNFVVRYWTKRITGLSEPQTLSISGNFQEFREKILEYWKSNKKFEALAQLVEV